MDRSADACQDLYALACGGLVKNVEIPADKASWGPAQELQLRTEELLRSLLEKAAKAPGEDPIQKKLGAWYGACMDEGAIEKAGVKPLKPLLAVVDRVRDDKTLHAAVIELHRRGIFPLFSVSSQQDFKDATQVIAGLDQDGLGLPDRDYYLLDDPKMKEIRAFYAGHVERLLILGGDKQAAAKKAAEDVLRIETALAKLAQDKVARRDPYQVYHRVDRGGLAGAAKGFPWDAYWKALGFPELQAISRQQRRRTSPAWTPSSPTRSPPPGRATCAGWCSPPRRAGSARPSSTSASACGRSSSARRRSSPGGSAACSRPTAPSASSWPSPT